MLETHTHIRKNKIDTEVVLQLKSGSHAAFSAVYIACREQMFLLSLRYLKSRELAEDAVQYAFMRLWETREAIDPLQGIEPYVYGILKNHLLNVYRHEQMKLEKNEEIILSMPLFAEENILQTIYHNQRKQAIERALASLTPQRRRICELKVFDGLSNHEVADRLHISVNTVKVAYYKSILQLRETLKENEFIWILILFIPPLL